MICSFWAFTGEVRLFGDYYEINNIGLWLKQCINALPQYANCIKIKPGSIVLTVGTDTKEHLANTLSDIENNGLQLATLGKFRAENCNN